jgi:hypothetical protein
MNIKKLFLISLTIFLLSNAVLAQPERVGAGLSFASKDTFNNGFTGNPGLNIRTWIALDKGKKLHFVPSITAYKPLVTTVRPAWQATTYMLHGDIDFQYRVYQENTLSLAILAGLNITHIISKNSGDPTLLINYNAVDASRTAYGPTIGASLEMRMSAFWDFILSTRYSFTGIRPGDPVAEERFLVAPFATPVIQVHGVYYFGSRGRGYSRR